MHTYCTQPGRRTVPAYALLVLTQWTLVCVQDYASLLPSIRSVANDCVIGALMGL